MKRFPPRVFYPNGLEIADYRRRIRDDVSNPYKGATWDEKAKSWVWKKENRR